MRSLRFACLLACLFGSSTLDAPAQDEPGPLDSILRPARVGGEICTLRPPAMPALGQASQFDQNGDHITIGGEIEGSAINLAMTSGTAYQGYGYIQQFFLEIEVRPMAENFTRVPTHVSSPRNFNNSGGRPFKYPDTAVVQLKPGTFYKWAARERMHYCRCEKFEGGERWCSAGATVHGNWQDVGVTTGGAFQTAPPQRWQTIQNPVISYSVGRHQTGGIDRLNTDDDRYYVSRSAAHDPGHGQFHILDAIVEFTVPADARHLRLTYEAKASRQIDFYMGIDTGGFGNARSWQAIFLDKLGTSEKTITWTTVPLRRDEVRRHIDQGKVKLRLYGGAPAGATFNLSSDFLQLEVMVPDRPIRSSRRGR